MNRGKANWKGAIAGVGGYIFSLVGGLALGVSLATFTPIGELPDVIAIPITAVTALVVFLGIEYGKLRWARYRREARDD